MGWGVIVGLIVLGDGTMVMFYCVCADYLGNPKYPGAISQICFCQFCYHCLYPRIGVERGAGWFVLGRPKGSFERRELDSTLVVEI